MAFHLAAAFLRASGESVVVQKCLLGVLDAIRTFRLSQAIRKESLKNQAVFCFLLGYLNGGCLFILSGLSRRLMCWIAAILTHASLAEVLYS